MTTALEVVKQMVDDRGDARQIRLFKRHDAASLAAPVGAMRWLISGLLAEPTYGMTAGEMKTLKTYVTTITSLALASGQPAFGYFHVPEPRPVMLYVGEGGEMPFKRRLQRLASAMGLDLASLPIAASFEVAPLAGARFTDTLARDLAEVKPGLVIVDPYYAFHGAAADARSLHQEGDLLSGLSTQCLLAGSSLQVVNHFNQTGNGTGLKRITMVGGGEWSDSWLMLSHREDPDVAGGRFRLALEVGSRQWGGASYELDLNIGRFDESLGLHDGEVTWQIRTATKGDTEVSQRATVLQVLSDEPWTHTRTQLVRAIGGNAEQGRALIDAMVQAHEITAQQVLGQEGNRSVKRFRLALATEPRLDDGPGSVEEVA